MPKLQINTNLTDLKHSGFKVLGITKIGDRLFEVRYSVRFEGRKARVIDSFQLWGSDEFDVFKTVMKVYGDKHE
jgi:hypothetical protein